MPGTLEPLYTVETVAGRYHVQPRTVHRWIKHGYFPHATQPGGRVYLIPESDIVLFERRHMVSGVLDDDVTQDDDDDRLPMAAGE